MSYRRLLWCPRPLLCLTVLLLALPALAGDASWTTDDLVGTNESEITIDIACTGNPTVCTLAGLSSPYNSMRTTTVSGSGTAELLEGGSFEFDLDTALTTPPVDAWTAELAPVAFDPLGTVGTPTLTDAFVFGTTGGPFTIPGLVFGAFGPTAIDEMLDLGMRIDITGLPVEIDDAVVGPAAKQVIGTFEMLDDTRFEIRGLQFGGTVTTSESYLGATLDFTIAMTTTMNLSGELIPEDPKQVVDAAHCGGITHYAWVRDPEGSNPNIAYRNCNIVSATCSATKVLVAAPTAESAPSIACAASLVAVVWEDTRNGNPDIAYRRSDDGGASFAPLTFLAQGPADERWTARKCGSGLPAKHGRWRQLQQLRLPGPQHRRRDRSGAGNRRGQCVAGVGGYPLRKPGYRLPA